MLAYFSYSVLIAIYIPKSLIDHMKSSSTRMLLRWAGHLHELRHDVDTGIVLVPLHVRTRLKYYSRPYVVPYPMLEAQQYVLDALRMQGALPCLQDLS